MENKRPPKMRYRSVLAAYFATARYFHGKWAFFENSFPLVPVKGRLNNHFRDKAPFVWPKTRELGGNRRFRGYSLPTGPNNTRQNGKLPGVWRFWQNLP